LAEHPILSKKILKNHMYELVDVTTFENRSVYVIKFDRNEKYKKIGYTGKILIDTKSLAFVQIGYDISYPPEEPPKLFGSSKLAGMLLGLSESTWDKRYTELNFHTNNGKWYLKNARYDAGWTLVKEKNDLDETMKYFADFIITDIEKGDVTLPPKEELANNKILEQQYSRSTENFWESYNYLVPDKDFDRIFEEIQRRNLSTPAN
jgi:hypothetical protein